MVRSIGLCLSLCLERIVRGHTSPWLLTMTAKLPIVSIFCIHEKSKNSTGSKERLALHHYHYYVWCTTVKIQTFFLTNR